MIISSIYYSDRPIFPRNGTYFGFENQKLLCKFAFFFAFEIYHIHVCVMWKNCDALSNYVRIWNFSVCRKLVFYDGDQTHPWKKNEFRRKNSY